MDGNGYSHNIETPEGRVKQLETWVAANIPMKEHQDKFLDGVMVDLGDRTPREAAKFSIEMMLVARNYIPVRSRKNDLKL